MRILPLICLLAGLLYSPSRAEVKMLGSTSVFLSVVKPNKEEVSKSTGVEISATGATTGKGFKALQDKETDVALSTDSLAGLLKSARDKGDTALKAEDFEEIFLKDTAMVVVANAKNPLATLSEEQLRSVLKGEISSWAQLGGAEAPIVVFFEKESSGNHGLIMKSLMKESPLGAKRLIYVDNVRWIVSNVVETETGIGISPELYLNEHVKVISPFKIKQHLCFIIRKDAGPEVRQVVEAFKAKL
jgi:phosphate transport system substrate-binding protein